MVLARRAGGGWQVRQGLCTEVSLEVTELACLRCCAQGRR